MSFLKTFAYVDSSVQFGELDNCAVTLLLVKKTAVTLDILICVSHYNHYKVADCKLFQFILVPLIFQS